MSNKIRVGSSCTALICKNSKKPEVRKIWVVAGVLAS